MKEEPLLVLLCFITRLLLLKLTAVYVIPPALIPQYDDDLQWPDIITDSDDIIVHWRDDAVRWY